MGQYKEAVQRGITQLANATYALTRKFNELGLKSARDRLADWFPSVVEVKNHTLGVETTAYSRHQAQNIANFLREEGITANRSDVRIRSRPKDGACGILPSRPKKSTRTSSTGFLRAHSTGPDKVDICISSNL